MTMSPGGQIRRGVALAGFPTGGGGDDIDDPLRIVGIAAEQAQMLSRGTEGGLGVVLGVLRNLQVLLSQSPVLVQHLRSI